MGVYFGYYVTFKVFLELQTHPQMLSAWNFHDMTVFSSTIPCASSRGKGPRNGGKRQILKQNLEAGAFVFLTPGQALLSSLLLQRSSKVIDLAQRWCSSQNLFRESCRATEYLKDLGFQERNTKKNETCHALEQWFSAMGYFAPRQTSDNVWGHFWLSQRGRVLLALSGEMLINILQCLPQERIIWV